MRSDSSAITLFQRHSMLRVRQKKEWGEILTGFEMRNKYQVVGDDEQPLFFVGEVDGGLGGLLARLFLKAQRPFTLELKTPDGATLLRLKRPWRWWFAHLDIEDGAGQHLGSIQQRFAFFERLYEVHGPSGEVLATLRGPFFKPWTFLVELQGREVGKIQKQWSGFGKELFTAADNFGVSFGDIQDSRLRTLVVGATFLIDFVHFEKRD
ncbi:phospholipid scramblase-related protein [Hyalangium versicolor]|uniref:phospholipid scramblase-related protein n=1 Tax=Hyalangium versicolor TaxID=2861190 RepID=UPI001CC987C3|nr:phospholipid scramblase-related protein [Hyalangium versicolor]